MIFNSAMSWQINTTYDIQTVALHEFGHSLGMGHTTDTNASMYASYMGEKQEPTTDDIRGSRRSGRRHARPVQQRRPEQFELQERGESHVLHRRQRTDRTPDLSIHSTTLNEWFYVTVPASTTGTMVATMQSSNLSSLSPRITVFDTSLKSKGTASSTAYGDTVSVSIPGVQAGQGFYIRV